MDATGRLWRSHALKGKLASGFTVSALPSGDKQSTLTSMFVFAMQHGMYWVGKIPGMHDLRRRDGGVAMIPRRFEPVLFSLVVSGPMSLILSGVSTAATGGLPSGFAATWMKAWATAWLLAFAIVLLVGPLSRKLVQRLLKAE